jgi:hypothetical protein
LLAYFYNRVCQFFFVPVSRDEKNIFLEKNHVWPFNVETPKKKNLIYCRQKSYHIYKFCNNKVISVSRKRKSLNQFVREIVSTNTDLVQARISANKIFKK